MKRLQPDTLIRNPTGRPIVASRVIDCQARRVWNMVGTFSGFDVFIPALSHIEMTGTGVGALRTKFSEMATRWWNSSIAGMSTPCI